MFTRLSAELRSPPSTRCFSFTTVIAAIAIVMSPYCLSSLADSIEVKLFAANEKYEKGRTEAKTAVLDRYREVITALSEKKMIEEATRAQNEMKHFEKSGLLLARTDILDAFSKYGAKQKTLADELTEAYNEAAAAHIKAGNLDRAAELRSELVRHSLPTKLVSIKLLRTNAYIQHGDYKGWVKSAPNAAEKLNGTFEIVAGLAEPSFVSFRSISCPNHYFNHGNKRMLLSPLQDNEVYRQNATFKRLKGLAAPSGVSFESVNLPDHFIRSRNGELWLDKNDRKDQFRQEATFSLTDPLFKYW